MRGLKKGFVVRSEAKNKCIAWQCGSYSRRMWRYKSIIAAVVDNNKSKCCQDKCKRKTSLSIFLIE